MSKPSEAVGKRMRKDLENAYMEIIPVPGIEERLGTLQRNMHVAVTCSPTKGVDETIELSGKLMAQGFQVIPHIAAKSVSGEKHLETIVKRLDALSIENILCLVVTYLNQWVSLIMPMIFLKLCRNLVII
jgi:methylenetetrahydrofolate reductase (NADPH)